MSNCCICIADKEYCKDCCDNPIYPKKSYYKAYEPFCPFGYIDCVYDPNYVAIIAPTEDVEIHKQECLEEYEISKSTGICPGYDYEDK